VSDPPTVLGLQEMLVGGEERLQKIQGISSAYRGLEKTVIDRRADELRMIWDKRRGLLPEPSGGGTDKKIPFRTQTITEVIK